jgi:hypothetical protein
VRRLGPVSLALFTLVASIAGGWWFASQTPAAFAQQSSAPKLVLSTSTPSNSNPTLQPANLPSVRVATPGTEFYTAKRGDSIPLVAHQNLRRTSYLTSSELADAIRKSNGNRTGNILKAGEEIVIPGILTAPIIEKSIPVPKDFEVRAIYLTGVMAGSDHGLRIIRHWHEVGGNAVVFDIKDSDGSVNIAFDHPFVGKHNVYIHDLPKFTRFLHSEGMHAIARIAMFRDEKLVVTHPELAVQSRRTGGPWRENGKLVWTDPSQPKVQDYDIALAKYVASSGVDEIQFDYVRFPAEGDQKDAKFFYQGQQPDSSENQSQDSPTEAALSKSEQAKSEQAKSEEAKSNEAQPKNKTHIKSAAHTAQAKTHNPQSEGHKGMQRSEVIANFLDRAYAQLHPTGVLLSLDVFGIMAWQRPVDLAHTGQDIVAMARHCDVLSPMIYPSHFFGMDGIARPGDAPEHFIGESMDRFKLITKDSGVVLRPWLQAFAWRTKTYSTEYIKTQVEVAKEKGGVGFLFWNANNDYSKPYTAMPEMRAAKDKYFRGDELPTTAQAMTTPTPTAQPSPASAR